MAKSIDNESFEFNYKKLEKIMQKLESELDETSLDELMKNYQEGLKLINICRKKLKEAELKIEKINSEYNN
ncbi:MAG TPA: exodeoxyribonuclease VII small subunit [Bacteroidetes bacterium]|nr:exodeoxyribonuclease VII small subunit [Ignavibacteria bacterium]HCA42345.1 exodeoxyribonuclease VII small subunit [Bacteroidota bacterium]HCN37417.1 exodeoxyribonuclease VII small subunit [Bacteroidota bacterium]